MDPLQSASRKGHVAILQLCAEQGTDTEGLLYYRPASLLSNVEKGHHDIVRLLKTKQGGRSYPSLIICVHNAFFGVSI